MSDLGDAAKVEVTGFNSMVYMSIKGEGWVEDDTKVAYQGGGSDGG